MNKMYIYEPAMCCETGLCGVGIDPELLRISTVLNTLKKSGIEVQRYNLSSAPQEFIKNKEINDLINSRGINILPATVLDGKIILTGRYLTNEEFSRFLNIPLNIIGEVKNETNKKKSGGCSCGGGCC